MSSETQGPSRKRYRKEVEQDLKDTELDNEDEDYVPYVSVKERRKQKLTKLGRISEIKMDEQKRQALQPADFSSDNNSSEAEHEAREQPAIEDLQAQINDGSTSLLLQHSKLKKIAEARQESERDKRLKEEERLLQSVKEHTALMGAAELAKGIQYEDPIKTSWKPPKLIEDKPSEYHDRYSAQWIFSTFMAIYGKESIEKDKSHEKNA